MRKLRLLDLFCGAGGAARGYQLAGFHVTGVDINPQPHYVGDEFVQADALKILAGVGHRLELFDAIHASPTCQTRARVTAWRGRRENHPDTLLPTLRLLDQTGRPWVVENVPEAAGDMRPDLELCGTQFGLRIRRNRIFQLGNWATFQLMPPCHHHRSLLPFMHKAERAYADAMGCTWMTNHEARQAIPPVYTEYIGHALMVVLERKAAIT